MSSLLYFLDLSLLSSFLNESLLGNFGILRLGMYLLFCFPSPYSEPDSGVPSFCFFIEEGGGVDDAEEEDCGCCSALLLRNREDCTSKTSSRILRDPFIFFQESILSLFPFFGPSDFCSASSSSTAEGDCSPYDSLSGFFEPSPFHYRVKKR